jgi:hypothetical protein
VEGCQLASILHIDVRFGEHFREGDECKAVVSDCAEYEDNNISNYIDLSWIIYERFDVLYKQKDVNYVTYVVDG